MLNNAKSKPNLKYCISFAVQSTFNVIFMEKQLEDLKAIREMMEKSTKFLSLSGMSGVLAGVTAVCGAAFAWFYLLQDPAATNFNRFQETLILLGISALFNPAAQAALEQLTLLRGCEVHLTHIPTPGDEAGLRKLNVNVTCDPEYSSKSLFVS